MYTPTITVLGRYCSVCDHTYYSRTRHDMTCCPCWISSKRETGGYIDGGRDYCRVGGKGEFILLTLPVTQKQLHKDWNTQQNKYGLIKGRYESK